MTYLKISNEYEQSNKKPSNFDKQLSLGNKIEHDSKTRDSPQEELTDENEEIIPKDDDSTGAS